MKKNNIILSLAFFIAMPLLTTQIPQKLTIIAGTSEDWPIVKQFSIDFFTPAYDQIPADQKEFTSTKDWIEQKFKDHYPRIFETEEYKFFLIKNDEEFIGYSIFSITENVYSIETQVNFKKYEIKSIMNNMISFISNTLAPEAEYLIVATRIAVPSFGMILESCNFTKSNMLHDSLKSLEAYYQGYEFKLK